MGTHDALQKSEKRIPIERFGKGEVEPRIVQRYRTKDMCRLAFASSGDPRLTANPSPGAMQGRVELEACLILE